MQNDLMKVVEVGELQAITRRDENGNQVPIGTFESGEPAVKRDMVLRAHTCAVSQNSGLYPGMQQVVVQLLGTMAQQCTLQAGQWIVGAVHYFARPGTNGYFQDARLLRYAPIDITKL